MLTWGDLFWSWVSLYNTLMKCFFIGSSVYILYLMKWPFRPTHDPNLDTFKIEYLLIGSFVAALIFNYEFSLSEVPLPPSPTESPRLQWLTSRSSGRLVFGLKVWLFYHNYSSFKEQEKQKTSRPIIYLLWARIALYTSQIGCGDTLRTIILIPSLLSRDWFR
jgi:hypothetical protein